MTKYDQKFVCFDETNLRLDIVHQNPLSSAKLPEIDFCPLILF